MEMSELLKEFWLWKGKKAQVNINGLLVNVQILDLRQVWNRLDAKITPISGDSFNQFDKHPQTTRQNTGKKGRQ